MYSIKIEELTESDNQKYPNRNEIYVQEIENLDIKAVIAVVNGLKKDSEK